jgi:hypothetical protein
MKFEDATAEDLERLIQFIDENNPQGHVMKEIRIWVHGTAEFADMNSMLLHFTRMVDDSEDSVL